MNTPQTDPKNGAPTVPPAPGSFEAAEMEHIKQALRMTPAERIKAMCDITAAGQMFKNARRLPPPVLARNLG